jgi:hypothetical protein
MTFTISQLRKFIDTEFGEKKKPHSAALSKLESHSMDFCKVFMDPTCTALDFKEHGMEMKMCYETFKWLKAIMVALMKHKEYADQLHSIKLNVHALDSYSQIVNNVYDVTATDSNTSGEETNDAATDIDASREETNGAKEDDMVVPELVANTVDDDEPLSEIDVNRIITKRLEEVHSRIDELHEKYGEAIQALQRKNEFMKKMVRHLMRHASPSARETIGDMLFEEQMSAM